MPTSKHAWLTYLQRYRPVVFKGIVQLVYASNSTPRHHGAVFPLVSYFPATPGDFMAMFRLEIFGYEKTALVGFLSIYIDIMVKVR